MFIQNKSIGTFKPKFLKSKMDLNNINNLYLAYAFKQGLQSGKCHSLLKVCTFVCI